MKQIVRTIILASFAVIMPALVITAVTGGVDASAIDPGAAAGRGLTAAGGSGSSGGGQLEDSIKVVVNVLLFVVGAVAVIMIVIGGLKYTISNGDSSQVTSAKNTVLYSVVGLVIALFAYAIVNFVLTQF